MKRLTDTEIWRAPWFLALKPKHKLLWRWLVDRCDNAGMIEVHWGLASLEIGFPLEEADMEALNGRVQKVRADKWHIPKFVVFQFGELHEGSRVHQTVLKLIASHKASDSLSATLPPTLSHTLPPTHGHPMPMGEGQGQGQGRGGVGEIRYSDDFRRFWEAYPKKVGKGAAWKAWQVQRPPVEKVIPAIAAHQQTEQWRKERGQFIPYPETWLRQRRWEDEVGVKVASKPEPTKFRDLPEADQKAWREAVLAHSQTLLHKPDLSDPAAVNDLLQDAAGTCRAFHRGDWVAHTRDLRAKMAGGAK